MLLGYKLSYRLGEARRAVPTVETGRWAVSIIPKLYKPHRVLIFKQYPTPLIFKGE